MNNYVKKLLAFLKLGNSVTFEDDKANLTIAEADLEKSAELFDKMKTDAEDLQKENQKLAKDLQEVNKQVFTAKNELDKTNSDLVELTEANEKLEAENETLRNADGAVALLPKKKVDGGGNKKFAISDNNTRLENLAIVREQFNL